MITPKEKSERFLVSVALSFLWSFLFCNRGQREEVETNVLMSKEEATDKLDEDSIETWRELAGSITSKLTSIGLTWYHVNHPAHEGPNHWGWSRMVLVVTESYKAKKYGKLPSASKHTKGRNSNEQGWLLKGLTNYSASRWNSVYRNQPSYKVRRVEDNLGKTRTQ